jgi:predicted nucleic acid-binding protein
LKRGWVVDASVAVKLYLPEDLSGVAESFFQKARSGRSPLFVPDLFFTECANIFWKNVRRLKIAPDHARTSLSEVTSLTLLPVSSTDLLLDSLDLALEFGSTAYDASYAALAQQLRLPLVTADEKLIGKLEGSGINTVWLGDLAA